ncbi:hypoxanthine-guanine phosphoribosyltransferase [Porticoccaceae bacterium LTM1]|nr:hypoxanthine-guanine phosphoribosyltransferase [Porticoccaceae bacterium LTM1]
MSELPDVIEILDYALELSSGEEVDSAIDRIASDITKELGEKNPIVICVMNGGIVFTGQLLPRLRFPLEFDYLHATRYRGATIGDSVHWLATPQSDMKGRAVLIVDDIFDEGYTLETIIEYCKREGADSVHTAVLVEKRHDREKANIRPDFVGLSTSDLYLFGSGMDYQGYWRNLPGIYGLKVEYEE